MLNTASLPQVLAIIFSHLNKARKRFRREQKGSRKWEKVCHRKNSDLAKRTTAAVSGREEERRGFFLIENRVTRHCFEEVV